MTFAHKVARITIAGTCFGGLEEWTTGFYMGASGTDATAPSQTFMDNAAGYWQTFFTAVNSKVSNRYQTTFLKGVLVGTDGKTIDGTTKFHNFTTAISGNKGADHAPPQCSLVATLTSAVPRGQASKGRMYLPGIASPVDTTGHLPSTDISGLSGTFSTFLNALNADIEQPGRLILASKAGGTVLVPTLPINRDVTGYKIGNVYDTQRRRRDQLVEVYTGGVVA